MSNIPYANSSIGDVTPSWVPTTDPGYQTASDMTTAISGKQDTLSNGVGVTIHNNTVSIGQSVSNSASPIFNQLTLGNAGINEGVINLQDLTNFGTDTIANIKGILDGDNGGQLEFHTKEDGDSVTKKMSIKEDGKVVINRTLTIGPENPEGWSLIINGTNAASTGIGLCRNGQEQIGSMYISSNPDKDFVLDAYSPLSNMGILFRTGQGLNRLRIGVNGEFEVNGDSGSQNDILTSNGPNAPPSWITPTSGAPGDLGDAKIRGDREFHPSGDVPYTGAVHGIRAFHLYLTNASFANPSPSNATLSFTDYYGCRIGSMSDVSTISFPNNHVYFHLGYSQGSDDRLKHNETPITDGLSVINQINVLRYDKSKDFTTREDMKIEVGMIAQEVQTIPQLSHCVIEPMYEEDNYRMVYQDIHNYHIAATQELYKLVLALQARIDVLESSKN
jgi:hypothetical protein